LSDCALAPQPPLKTGTISLSCLILLSLRHCTTTRFSLSLSLAFPRNCQLRIGHSVLSLLITSIHLVLQGFLALYPAGDELSTRWITTLWLVIRAVVASRAALVTENLASIKSGSFHAHAPSNGPNSDRSISGPARPRSVLRVQYNSLFLTGCDCFIIFC
jgi:hypothetical protein